MKKTLYLLASLVILLSSCGKDPQPDPIKNFSVLGDSFSTFEGYVDPETNDVWSYYETIGVTEVEQLWWYQVAQSTGWTLEKNNSFSGSLVCNMNHANYYGPHSFLRRMDDLGNPDVILVFGGTNDMWDNAPMGEFKYSDWTDEELCTFRPALAALFDGLERKYPKAKIYFLADDALGDTFMESVKEIVSHYKVINIPLHNITKDWMHPNAQGMTEIASQLLAALREEA